MLSFPTLTPDPSTRAGRMLEAGRVKVTVLNEETSEHTTVLLKCFADNRDRQYDPDQNKNWAPCPYAHATHVFVEVPSAGDGWNDYIGTFYPKTGRWYDADHADPQRVYAAYTAFHWLNGNEDIPSHFTCSKSSECGRCGHEPAELRAVVNMAQALIPNTSKMDMGR